MLSFDKKTIGIFGGSFDPPHKGHVEISKIGLKKIKLKKIYWIITKKNPFKKKPFFSLKQRISFKFQDLDFKEAMALMSEIGNINILVGDEVAGAVSAELENVPWDKAFNALLDLKSYAADIDVASNIIRVSTPTTLTSQESYKSARASAVKK